MAEGFSIELVEDNSPMVIAATDEAIKAALEAVALTVERYAKEICPVDTGRLRNSITHVSGVGGGFVHGFTDNSGAEFSQNVGQSNSADVIYVGTNVEYAPYVELGTRGRRGANNGKGYLRPAVTEHTEEYKRIIETHLKKVT